MFVLRVYLVAFLAVLKRYSDHLFYLTYVIAPFKFDAPSPDDLVSNGLKSSRTGSKGDPHFAFTLSLIMFVLVSSALIHLIVSSLELDLYDIF